MRDQDLYLGQVTGDHQCVIKTCIWVKSQATTNAWSRPVSRSSHRRPPMSDQDLYLGQVTGDHQCVIKTCIWVKSQATTNAWSRPGEEGQNVVFNFKLRPKVSLFYYDEYFLMFLPRSHYVCFRLQPTTRTVPCIWWRDALPRVPSRKLRAASNAAGVQPLRTVWLSSTGSTTDAAVFCPTAASLPPAVPPAALVIKTPTIRWNNKRCKTDLKVTYISW